MFSPFRNSRVTWPIVMLQVILIAGLPVCPGIAQAQNAYDPGTGCLDGEAAGQRAVSGGSWFIIGCFGGIIGLLVANLMDPSVPASQLLGKDPAYVAAFSDCYKSKVKGVRTKSAVSGCLTSTALVGLFYVVMVVLVIVFSEETIDYDYGY